MNEKLTVQSIASVLEQAAVSNAPLSGDSFTLEERAGCGIVRLHTLPDAVPGAVLPSAAGRCAGDDPAILCLRPGEWLLLSPSIPPTDLLRHAREQADGDVAVTDQSDAFGVLRLAGVGAPWLLAKLSGLDFLAGRAAGPHCSRTRMGDIAVVVHYREDEGGIGVFDLLADRSLTPYLWQLLAASGPHADELARQYGDAA